MLLKVVQSIQNKYPIPYLEFFQFLSINIKLACELLKLSAFRLLHYSHIAYNNLGFLSNGFINMANKTITAALMDEINI